jgi:GTP-binding protein
MFIDEVTVEVYGGKGGNGMASYRREKYVEFGGPWGGNGGRGGSVVFVGEEGEQTLINLQYRRHIKADKGVNGLSKGQHGANASNVYVKVPLGTIVYNADKTIKIGEITKHQQELVVAKGGKGGRGNMAFATHRNPAPDFAENGDPGEYFKISVELKVLADVGMIGYPSVGKSTLLSVVSNSKPKIAAYPFTTLQPNLGMVYVGDEQFVLADLPGLIEDAHQGHGLGIRFLKHIERCRLFLHVVDLTVDDPYETYQKINHELEMYDEALLERPQIVVCNKIDMPGAKEAFENLKNKIDHPMISISAIQKTNLNDLLYLTIEQLKHAPKMIEENVNEEKVYTFVDDTEEKAFEINIEDGVYVLTGSKIELLFTRTDFSREDGIKRFARQLRTLGVDEALRNKGCKHHDTVRILKYEFEFIE